MKPTVHLWIRKEAMEALSNFKKCLSIELPYSIIFKLALDFPWATHKGSPRVAQEETIDTIGSP